MIAVLEQDLTGTSPDNLIEDEVNSLVRAGSRGRRLTTTRFGPFYRESLIVRDLDGTVLNEGVDFVSTYYYPDASDVTGHEICGMVVIINAAVSDQISLTYQALGGGWVVSNQEVKDAIVQLEELSIPFEWDSIVGRPLTYAPSEHQHKYWQVYGLERLIPVLDRVEYGVTVGHDAAFAMEEAYLKTLVDEVEDRLEQYEGELDDHVNDTDNPHELTAEQIELELLENYPLASESQALDSSNDSTYVTPLRVGEVISSEATPLLVEHLLDRSNPHGVTAAQIQAYTRPQADSLLNGKLDYDATAHDSGLLGGNSYNHLYQDARKSIPAGNVTEGRFHQSRLGSGGAHNNSHILRGDSRWVSLASIFDQYEKDPVNVHYASSYGSVGNALSSIRTTYSNINAYPVGTIVLYRLRQETRNGRGWWNLWAAVRTAGGWTSY